MADRLLQIPDYQRGFAWEGTQVAEFLDDVMYLPDGMTHFTGTVVLHPTGGGRRTDVWSNEYATADVVDGQQRLTTSVLVLDQIRRRLVHDDSHGAKAEGIERLFISVPEEGTQVALHKLRLGPDTHDFWMNVVLSDTPDSIGPANLAEKRLLSARDQVSAWLDDMSAAEGTSGIIAVLGKISNRLGFLLYEVDTAAEVGVIFEVMNDRGKPLTELEKVKNYVLYAAAKLGNLAGDLPAETNRAAAVVYEQLMTAGLTRASHEDQLLRADWLMRYDPDPRNWEGVRSIKQHFAVRDATLDPDDLRDRLLTYVAGLRNAAVAYADINYPTRTGAFASFGASAPGVVRASERLRRVGALASFLPVLMAARVQDPTGADHYRALAESCERYAFRVYRILQLRANAGQTRIFKLGHRLHSGTVSPLAATDELAALTNAYCTRAQFQGEFDREDGRNWYVWAGLGYLLYEYEAHLTGGVVEALPWDQLDREGWNRSIEHILPQTPDKRSCWMNRFTDLERDLLTDDIGNLVLTLDNSKLGTKCFVDKVGKAGTNGCYASSTLKQEQQLVHFDDWVPDSIRERRNQLRDWALERWAVSGDEHIELGLEDVDDED